VIARHLTLLLLALSVGGCVFFRTPSGANIKLRKKIQDLEGQIGQLNQQHQADQATIRGLAGRTGTTPVLEPGRMDKLFTTHAIRVSRLTGGADLDPAKPGDEGFKVYVNTLDQHGDMIKSAGSFVVDAFDLSDPQSPRLGHWEFPVEKAQDNWHSFLTRYEYVLTCPWQNAVPRHPGVTVKLTFTDELTGRKFDAQRVAKVEVPVTAATQPVGLSR
jgi:hypothetical protein